MGEFSDGFFKLLQAFAVSGAAVEFGAETERHGGMIEE